uniref:Uncharacterized protein n=1 Tax=Clandestinovirus TaxID=2831644 RepID=A0A8F8KQV0_9VIRU|nr:hypothetical protein KOM_12_230 [Clandestinovirus]
MKICASSQIYWNIEQIFESQISTSHKRFNANFGQYSQYQNQLHHTMLKLLATIFGFVLLSSALATDYVSVSYCDVDQDGIQRNYVTNHCFDNSFTVSCNAAYSSVFLKDCQGNLLGTYKTGSCIDGSPVWAGKSVFITCDNFHPEAPNGWTADIVYPASTVNCDQNTEPVSSFFYASTCQNANRMGGNFTVAPCSADGITWYTCTSGCRCTPVGQTSHNSCYDNGQRAIRCGGVPIATPTASPVNVDVPMMQSSTSKILRDALLMTIIQVFLLWVLNL